MLELNGQKIDVSKYGKEIFSRIDPVYVNSEKEALAKVKSGDVLAALIIPPDLTQKLSAGTGSATVRVYYNAEDPVKAQFVQDTIKAEVQDANIALTKQFTKIALNYLDLISKGGQISIFGTRGHACGYLTPPPRTRVGCSEIRGDRDERNLQITDVARQMGLRGWRERDRSAHRPSGDRGLSAAGC